MHFVKIWSTILNSSVWDESPDVRVMWLTFLCLADAEGFVEGVESSMARAANLPKDRARAAIDVLQAPDLESKSQEYGGRRVDKTEGGWQVLNYAKYRELQTPEQARDAARKRRERAKAPQSDASGTSPDPTSTSTSTSPSTAEPAQTRTMPGDGVFEYLTRDHHKSAWLDAATRARSPKALAHELRLLAEGGERIGKGAQEAFGWPVVGEALHAVIISGAQMTSIVLQAFCKRIVEDGLRTADGGEGVLGTLHEEAMKRLQASQPPGGSL